jgi:hypothetical protein
LWQKLGFSIVGTLLKAFQHPVCNGARFVKDSNLVDCFGAAQE